MFRSWNNPQKKLVEVLSENTIKTIEQRKVVVSGVQSALINYITKQLTAHSLSSTVTEKSFNFDKDDEKYVANLSGCSDSEKRYIGEYIQKTLTDEGLGVVRTGLSFTIRWNMPPAPVLPPVVVGETPK